MEYMSYFAAKSGLTNSLYYLKLLFECIFYGKNVIRRDSYHMFINRNVKTNIFSYGHFYCISHFPVYKITLVEIGFRDTLRFKVY